MNLRASISFLVAGLLAVALSCSSDPEAPVSKKFLDDGSFGVKAGATYRVVIPVTTRLLPAPLGVGTSPLLWLGESQGIRYGAILIHFDFSSASSYAGKAIATARLRLPIQTARPTITATFHELDGDFSDADSISAVPPYDPLAIAGDSPGDVERRVSYDTLVDDTLRTKINDSFVLDKTIVSEWLSGARDHHGIAIIWAEDPNSVGFVEMNAHERGTDPPALRVKFADGDSTAFGADADYTVATYDGGGLDCLGGIARRIYFGFDLGGLPKRAMVNAAFLRLKTIEDEGQGATTEELILGYSPTFYYYLYAPKTADTLGLGEDTKVTVYLGDFDPAVSQLIGLPIGGYVRDILRGTRPNRGLVLQSNLEGSRIQKAAFYSSGNDGPRVEIIYSMPADFRSSP
jgi:hypothetical protein